MFNNKILVVEDEERLAFVLKDYLNRSNFEVELLHRGDEVEEWLEKNETSLVILDLMLPGKNGVEICESIRKNSDLPIIMATAKLEEFDRLLGLEIGADDYICKPYSPREVVARVKAVLKRSSSPSSISEEDILSNGLSNQSHQKSLQLNERRNEANNNGLSIQLTKVEFNLLKILTEKPGNIFSRDVLIKTIYEHQRIVNDRTIDSHIKKIRQKLSKIGIKSDLIHSVYGVGYRFVG